MIEFDLAVDDGVVDAIGELVGLCKGGVVDDGCGIEDGDVREVAWLEEAAIDRDARAGREEK